MICAFFLAPFLWLLSAAFDGKASAYIQFPGPADARQLRPDLHRATTSRRVLGEQRLRRGRDDDPRRRSRSSLAGYSLSRIELRRKDWITYAVLLLQTMPLSATMVPIYGLARDLGLRNSYLGLILIHAAIELPFLIWLMKGFFDSIPRHLEEAAWLDGRSKLRALVEIVLPLARPGLGIAAGLAFLSAWSEVLMVVILVDQDEPEDRAARVLPDDADAGRLHRGPVRRDRGDGRASTCCRSWSSSSPRDGLMVRGLMSSTRGL